MSVEKRLSHWTRNKLLTEKKVRALRASPNPRHVETAERLSRCGSHLKVKQTARPYGRQFITIRPFFWCNLKVCTICATWRMGVWEERITDSMMRIGTYHQFSCRWYFMTISLRTVEYKGIGSRYERLRDAFRELVQLDEWPYSAYIRIFNAKRTLNWEANCHLHVLGMLCDCHSPVLDHLEFAELLRAWIEASGVNYRPYVDLTHPLTGYDDPFAREEEVGKVVGYCMKPDPVLDDADWLYEKATQLRGRHDVTTSRKDKALKGVLTDPKRRGRPESWHEFFLGPREPGTEIYGWDGTRYVV